MASAAEAALNDVIVRPRAEIFYKRHVRLDIRDEEVVSCYHLDRELIILFLDRIRHEIAKSGKGNGIDAELQGKKIHLKKLIFTIF